MRIEQLMQILEISKQKSISKAARVLFVFQPSLSNALSQFEEEINVTIFERTHSGVQVTPEGEDILFLIENALSELEKIKYYSCEKKDFSGEVRVLHTPAYGFMTYKLINVMKATYPKVRIVLDERPLDELLGAIQNGAALIGVLTWGLFREQTDEKLAKLGLTYRKMNTRKLKAYISSDHPLSGNDEITLNDLRGQQFISYSSAYWKRLEEGLQVTQDAMIMKDTDDIKKGVYKGKRIALLPDLFAIDDIYCEQGLIRLASIESDISMEGYDCIVHPTNKALSVLEKDVIIIIERILRNEDILCAM